jgi:simple sugar transport system permease protein
MAINLIAAGGTNFALSKFGDPTQTGAMPSLPLVLFLVSAFASPFVLFAFARSSRPGLRLLAVGSDDEKAALVGINPFTVRAWALAMTGVFTGLAGALLVTNVGTFTDGMTAGRGFIALAALILGRWKPLLALGACLVFGFFEALQLQLQGTQVAGSQVPSQVWSALPYAITVLALAFWMKPRQTASKLVLD